MLRLPILEAKRSQLENCVFCPKLCRSTCPVSNADRRETVTPWGKMSMAYFAGQGDLPPEPSYASPAWACTGCYACREACDHKNNVATTLYAARDGFVREGTAPAAATRALDRFQHDDAHFKAKTAALGIIPPAHPHARDALLIGCEYTRGAPTEARQAIGVASRLVGKPVRPVDVCCGLPLLLAGDASRFKEQACRFANSVRQSDTLSVMDAGCAMALRKLYPEHGVMLPVEPELLVERAARSLDSLRPKPPMTDTIRYHDPCQLGRGLGVYNEPREVLARVLGARPGEFVMHHSESACSGGGGLLPATMPDVSARIADARLDEHGAQGGGRIVTACASSLRRLRARRRFPVDDLITWIARSLEIE